MKIDSCLILLNKASAIDENYFNAFTKSKFLTFRKDSEESIKNKKKVELRLNQPLWKTQRSHFFDIDGNRTEAEKKYNIELLSLKTI
jgi:hypothetical protein